MGERPQYTSNARKSAELNVWAKQYHEPALEPELAIIDSHHHVWDDHRGRYLIHELMEDIGTGHNIVATVYVETKSMYRNVGPVEMKPIGEVEFVNGIAAMSASGLYGKTHVCAGIVGYADFTLGEQVKPVLQALIAAGNGRLRGIRHGVTWDSGGASQRHLPRYRLLDPVFRNGLRCLEPLDLSFDAWLFYPQLPDLIDLMRSLPTLKVILNHVGGLLGIPPHDGKRDEIFTIWRKHIFELAKFPNLTVKVGGLGMLRCGWDFHRRDIPPSSTDLATAWRPYIETCIDAFGPNRCMMESNFPVDKQSCGYGVLWNALKRITQNCSETEKAALYSGTAGKIYRIEP